jgi:hypothetical protein
MERRRDSHLPDSARHKIAAGAIAFLGIALLYVQTVRAAPMRCSGEESICIINCKKNPDKSTMSICVTNCGVRNAMCKKTGCWDNGAQKYCGLLKQ